jgi:hypothetical protein
MSTRRLLKQLGLSLFVGSTNAGRRRDMCGSMSSNIYCFPKRNVVLSYYNLFCRIFGISCQQKYCQLMRIGNLKAGVIVAHFFDCDIEGLKAGVASPAQ